VHAYAVRLIHHIPVSIVGALAFPSRAGNCSGRRYVLRVARSAPRRLVPGLPLYTIIVDLERRMRCRDCDARGKASISIKWGAVTSS